MILLGILAALFGIALIVFRDFFWELTHFSNEIKGVRSERTELWDTWQILGGLVLIGIGAFVICAGVGEAQTEARESAEATGTATTQLAELDAAFAARIAEWESYDGDETISVDPREIGVDARRILYGRCFLSFYLYVVGFNNQQYNDFAYIPDARGEPSDCGPDGARLFFGETPLGGGWYDIRLAGSLDNFGTPTATFRAPTRFPTLTPNVVIVTATPEPDDAPTASPTQTPIYIVVTATPQPEDTPEAAAAG